MEIPVWGPDDLHLDPQDLGLQGSPTRVVKVFHPKVSRQCEKVRATDDASIQSACDTLVEFLQKKDLI
jgi:electron transfer flavoprotein beta subunit